MPVFWYYCKSDDCGIRFSWVFFNNNDPKCCPKCRSKDIERVGICWKKIQKEG